MRVPVVPPAGRRLRVAVPLALSVSLLSGCGDGGDDESGGEASGEAAEATCSYVESGSGEAEPPDPEPAYDDDVPVSFRTGIGDFSATLDAAVAPCTVNSFASLAEQGYFDGTSCHRMTVMTGFEVLQCGDPTGTGRGGPGYTIPDELDGAPEADASGYAVYPAGTLAMANTGQPDTGGSQFFLVYGDTQLAPDYTVFGTVDEAGVAAVRKAAEAGVTPVNGPQDGTPVTPVELESVTLD